MALTSGDFQLQSQIERLKASNRRLLRQLSDAKTRRQELVDAVYRAALDAASALAVPPVEPPKADTRKGTPETAIAVLSDWQAGKVTSSYSSAICAKRIARYADKVIELTEIQRLHHPVPECRVYLLGDLVEGELVFPGQPHLIDTSLYGQVLVTGRRILVDLVRRLLGSFERVRVVGVIGNHGIGGPSRREFHPETNADAMLYETARLVLKGGDDAGEPRLTWAANRLDRRRLWYAVDRVGDKAFLLFHGDQVKGGFADYPWYGFGKKILRWSNGGIQERFDYALSGHFHHPVKGLYGRVRHWGNGSPESSNEYAAERIGNQGEPGQLLLFAHPRRGVTAEYEVPLG